ncbi:MAG: glycosyltransferase [Deltaproteobacteria bacterium]|nr:glycosyltransferase [Deltaproteobacteria bacterium]
MKILFFTENTHRGGMDRVMINLINHWPDPQDELVLACNAEHPGLVDMEGQISRPVVMIRHTAFAYRRIITLTERSPILSFFRKLLSPIFKYLCFFISIFTLGRLIKKIGPDRVMIIMGGYPGGDTCRAAAIACRLWLKGHKPVLSVHNDATRSRWFEALQEMCIDLLVAGSMSRIVTVSHACAASFKWRGLLIHKRPVDVVYNGIPDMAAEALDSLDGGALMLPSGAQICLMLGTYELRKGHRFLIEVFKRVAAKITGVHLVICGYGKEHEVAGVKKMVSESGLSQRIHLSGFKSNVAALIAKAHVLVIPSQSHESFGLTAVEAMALRVPVVATNVGGIPEVVADGAGGFCFAPDDVSGFAEAVINFLTDEKLRREQGGLGYQRYQALFTASKMAERYYALVCNNG